ncbi:hypothetical protein [Sneathiella sp.]|uniref:relaxase/mobilization nuclease domain-containing protein n=1 Tax=Sneathiella sp. TaxID=1964365 RepID=UPI002614CB02|nr:hypothetical protein [Sneathiella sp.]MDF2368876.1 hypothetical protein [Sneathiella sp.]
MILKGNQRGGAKNLALHLLKEENEHIEVHDLRGFAASDLVGALNETYAVSKGTKCTKFLYSLSFNPPPSETVSIAEFEAAIERAEKQLGLSCQPRAIVFHEKEGRRHAHAVWSRIDIEEMKAIQMSFDHSKLKTLSRELFLEHGWKMPRGLVNSEERDPKNFTYAEWQQAKRIDKGPKEIKTAIQDAWAISDSKAAFTHALEERGYTLARGDRRGFVAVDVHGEVYSIPKKTNVRTNQVRERLGDEKDLPSVTEAKHNIAKSMLPTLLRFKEDVNAKEQQQKSSLLSERDQLTARLGEERQAFLNMQAEQQRQEALIRQSRFRPGVKGIWDRIRGEHKRIQQLNEQEAKQALERDQRTKGQFIANQLAQRRLIQERASMLKNHFHEQKQDLRSDISQFKEMQQSNLDARREEFKRIRKDGGKQEICHNRGPTQEH